MSFAFLDMIFGGKGREIDTYSSKHLQRIWLYHTYYTSSQHAFTKMIQKPKIHTILSNFKLVTKEMQLRTLPRERREDSDFFLLGEGGEISEKFF